MSTPSQAWWKLRVRFTLRALLVFVTLLMLWGGYHTNRGREERAAEEFFRDRGALFSYGPTLTSESIGDRIAWCYAKLVQTLWRERYIVGIEVFCPLEPVELAALKKLRHLESVMTGPSEPTRAERIAYVRSTPVNVRAELPKGAIRQILAEHNLKGLALQQWGLSDEDCRVIRSDNRLEGLAFQACRFSSEGLAEIVQAPNLRGLVFAHCQTDDSRIAAIPGSLSLESIGCQYTPVGKEFGAFVGRSPNVKTLVCAHASIDDDFLSVIGPHPALETLTLSDATVTDSSIPVLLQMRQLKSLTVASPNFSGFAKAQLKTRSPLLTIE